jgi:hypothetical protein
LLVDTRDLNTKHDKQTINKQKKFIEEYKVLLQNYLNSNINRQVEAIYAMQVYAEIKGFPKNFLAILFHQMYDLELIEEEAFYQWKDEVNDNYPNKGQALFHVRFNKKKTRIFSFLFYLIFMFLFKLQKWFNWLQEASEESSNSDKESNLHKNVKNNLVISSPNVSNSNIAIQEANR